MAQVVGGFLVPHDPMVFTAPDAVPPHEREAVHAAYAEAAARLTALRADVTVIVGADHYVLFGPGCLPPYLIATSEARGPRERLPGLARGPITVARDLANHIVTTGPGSGLDWPVARAITVDHSVAIPQRLLVDAAGVPASIPVYLNCGVEPLLPMARARALGEHVGRAVASWPGDERVVVIGSGGISHWVGTADMGRVNEDFDRWVLDRVSVGDIDALARLTDERLVGDGGNGALELRTFVAAMAAVGATGGDVIAYVPSPGWITGLGFAQLHASMEVTG